MILVAVEPHFVAAGFPLGFRLWHKKGVMKPDGRRRPLPPLDESKLNELALRYVGRFATTRAKLRNYLSRKVRERGWDGAREPDFAAIAERFAEQGYVDDSSFALSKSQSLTVRGYGKRRVIQTLRAAGIRDESAAARDHADAGAVSAALRFARRRKVGPYADSAPLDPRDKQKALAAMVRAGHGFELSRSILSICMSRSSR